LKHTYTSY